MESSWRAAHLQDKRETYIRQMYHRLYIKMDNLRAPKSEAKTCGSPPAGWLQYTAGPSVLVDESQTRISKYSSDYFSQRWFVSF